MYELDNDDDDDSFGTERDRSDKAACVDLQVPSGRKRPEL